MSPVRLLFDADAFLCLRKFDILDSLDQPPIECIMTQFIARHELSPIQDFITELEGAGKLTIEAVTTRTPAYECYKSFLKQGVHKEVRSKMISLEDQAQFFCKPSDFTTFDETWAKRLSRLK